MRLAEAGCEVVVNGLDPKRLDATAADIRKATGAKVHRGRGRCRHQGGPGRAVRRLPEPDILIANNAGPPFRDFRELDRQKMIDGVVGNMIVPIELIQRAIDPMIKKKFGRIVNITSGSVKMPLVGLDLSSGARAGLTAFLAGVARSVAQHNVTINFLLPGPFDTDRLRSNDERRPRSKASPSTGADRAWPRSRPAARPGRRIRRDLRVPVLDPRRLHHRAEHADGRRHLPRGVLTLAANALPRTA